MRVNKAKTDEIRQGLEKYNIAYNRLRRVMQTHSFPNIIQLTTLLYVWLIVDLEGYCTAKMIIERYNVGKSTTYFRLDALIRSGLLEIAKPGNVPKCWYIPTERGYAAIKAYADLCPSSSTSGKTANAIQ